MIPGWSVLQACLQHCKLPNVRFIQNLEGKKHNSIIFLWPVPLFLCLNSGNDGWSLKHTVHVCMRQGEERRNQGFKRALHRFIMMMTAAVCTGGPGLLFSSLLFHTVIFMVCVCPNCATTAAQIKKKACIIYKFQGNSPVFLFLLTHNSVYLWVFVCLLVLNSCIFNFTVCWEYFCR